jgi:hypothetical protein
MNTYGLENVVDPDANLVFARATAECVDHDGDLVDTQETWEHFTRWALTSGGIFVSHVLEPQVGIIKYWALHRFPVPNIYTVLQVTHARAWEFCKAGKFRGLSLGGTCVTLQHERHSATTARRIACRPTELSLVLDPTCPYARFDFLYERGQWIVPPGSFHKEVRKCNSTHVS